jgi:UDP-N-acetylmuramyl pentapeptide phosphotransferase/UDP-N-acetylglucosamine-1-phosphate transferase
VVITLFGWLIYACVRTDVPVTTILTYAGGAVLVSTISWLDDLRSLPFLVRLTFHTVGAAGTIVGVGYWQEVDLPFLTQLDLSWLGAPITLLWIVGLSNAYNFMDGIDGIAGAQAIVSGVSWVVLGKLADDALLIQVGLLIASSSAGFLVHNWSPARIFMGDVGAVFLGYTLAFLPLYGSRIESRLSVAGILPLWPFLFDAVFTLGRRAWQGENVFVAHRSHLYQRLVIAGFSHSFVSLLYVSLSMIGVALSVIWFLQIPGKSAIICITVPLLGLGLQYFVRRCEQR